jgi:hypothetical protein
MSRDLESDVQAKLRLKASREGWLLFRNNVGVLIDVNGRPVRFGLANDSKTVNKAFKSGDLIGIRPVLITQAMVGQVIGQFASVEVKREGWTYNDNDARQHSQAMWRDIINKAGGYAIFSTGEL